MTVMQVLKAADSVNYDDTWLDPIMTLFMRSWWTRAWVRQELMAAREPILLCGRARTA